MTKDEMMDLYYIKNPQNNYEEALKRIKEAMQNGEKYTYLAGKSSQDDFNWVATEETISNSLYTKGQPDPDLLIRTSGELRLSNFLPWQLVYSEFLFIDKNWPDFKEEDLDNAILEYQKRTRKFGAN